MSWLLLTILTASPARLVVGLEGDAPRTDMRTHGGAAVIATVVTALDDSDTAPVVVRRLRSTVVLDVVDEARAIAALSSLPTVRWIEREVFLPVRLRALPDDPFYPDQWHLHPSGKAIAGVDIGAEVAWDSTFGEGARVAILDDGFDLDHPDLGPRFATEGCDVSNDGVGCDGDADASFEAGDWHGTQTAGVIAATGFNAQGVVGVCPRCTLLGVRLIGGGGPTGLYSSGSAVAEALEWAVDHDADVINNSWGPPDGNPFVPDEGMTLWPRSGAGRPAGQLPQVLDEALTYAITVGRGGLGAVITWSAGNGNELITYDRFASDPRVVAVGAVGSGGRRAWYSDYGPPLDLSAPSSDGSSDPMIITTDVAGAAGVDAGDVSQLYGGTSAASAIVAGVAALVAARYPLLTGPQIIEAMLLGAWPIDPDGGQWSEGRSPLYGAGRVDAAGAMAAAALYYDGCTEALDLCGNGRDDDCDGETDEGCEPCMPDAAAELCDGRDNDCDGDNNEQCVCLVTERPTCAPCNDSSRCRLDALCRSTPWYPGTWCFPSCVDTGDCPPGFACNGEVCVLVPDGDIQSCADIDPCDRIETCDGLDNDGNGHIDDLPPGNPEADAERLACRGPGVCLARGAECVDGRWQCTQLADFEQEETRYDGLDNDCDGETDEVPRLLDLKGGGGCAGAPYPAVVTVLFALLLRRTRRRRRFAL